MSGIGWVKTYRDLLTSPIFGNEKLLKVYIWCTLKASHSERIQLVGRQQVKIMPGQFVTGRHKASEELGMAKSTTWDYFKLLESDRIINIKSNNKYSVVTIVNWGTLQSNGENSDIKIDNKPTTNGHKQELKNEKNKDINHFELFWNAYPKKVAKATAEKSFEKLKINEESLSKMLSALEVQKQSKQWQDKQYIPHASTWLNQRRWEDEEEITPSDSYKVKIEDDGAIQL